MKLVQLQRKSNENLVEEKTRFHLFSNRFSCVGPCFTANLNIDYVKPLLTPAWILVRAHVERQEGRKVMVNATVGNGEGDIYAKAVALFIKPKSSIPSISKDQTV